jgi:hypothetical protein
MGGERRRERGRKKFLDWVWWHVSVIPATWKVEGDWEDCSLSSVRAKSSINLILTNELSRMVHAYNLRYMGGIRGRIMVQVQPGQKCEIQN